MEHFVSESCKGECCTICNDPVTHKVGEEIPHDDPDTRHNYTAYVCCDCFRTIFGGEVMCDDKMSDTKRFKKLKIPEGHYCYEVVSTKIGDNGIPVRYVRYCPFWFGTRPNGGCLIFGWEPALGDACKSCGWLEPDEPIF